MEKLLKSRYKIEEKISENPFCITYKGSFIGTNAPLIIKIYRRNLLDTYLIKKLHQKAAVLSELNHPRIAKLLDGDYGWQGFYFVREYVEGQNLREYLKERKKINPEEAREIAVRVAEALSFAHAKRVVHGALHPNNILITQDGSLKVTDFIVEGAMRAALAGRAKLVVEGDQAFYFSPEQIKGEKLGRSSDIYALGLILYQMLTGALPFKGKNSLEITLKSLKDLPSPPSSLNSAVPKYLDDIVLKALEKDPWLRFSSAEEFLESLQGKAIILRKKELEVPEISYEPEEPLEVVEVIAEPDERIKRAVTREEVRKSQAARWIIGAIILAVTLGLGYALLQVILTR